MMCGLGARIRRNLQNAVFYPARLAASVMIEKFACMNGWVASEFLDLNHTSKSMLLVSFWFRSSLRVQAASAGGLRNRDTSLYAPHGLPREMAMSELRQQTIALWILLMLLILVPWALE
jgi:hypothetical protein